MSSFPFCDPVRQLGHGSPRSLARQSSSRIVIEPSPTDREISAKGMVLLLFLFVLFPILLSLFQIFGPEVW